MPANLARGVRRMTDPHFGEAGYELWFKQMLHELTAARDRLLAGESYLPRKALQRVHVIEGSSSRRSPTSGTSRRACSSTTPAPRSGVPGMSTWSSG
jgi:hypothetical protein